MDRTGVSDIDALWRALGFGSRQTFWRARRGLYDIGLAHAMRIAQTVGWPLTRVFEGGIDA